MIWALVIGALSGAAAESAPSHGAAHVLAVNTALQSDTDLLKLHRGYTAYLDAHPDLAKLEEAYGTLSKTPGFAPVAQAFDEALGQNDDAERNYTKYSAFLAANQAAQTLISGLNQMEAQQGPEPGGNGMGAALGYLRANPDQATSLLQNPGAVNAAPDALRPLLTRIQQNAPLRDQLVQRYQGIQQTPGAKENVYPWWQTMAGAGNVPGQYGKVLEQYLAKGTGAAQVWHERNAALAGKPAVRDWLRYWHGRVQRQSILARHYWDYLEYLKAHPEEKKQIAEQWQKSFGPPAPWPPAGTPPALAPLRVIANKQAPDAATRSKLRESQIRHPEIPRPARPERPVLRTTPVNGK